MTAKRRFNPLGLIVAFILMIACLMGLLAILSGNPFYAFNRISEEPSQVIIYYDGETYFYEPDSEEYDLLVEAAYETLRNEQGVAEFGWASSRFDQARTEGDAIELVYADPVKIPGNRVDIADVYRLFFPLDVFGWSSDVVFRGGRTMYWGLPVRVDTLDRLRDAVDEVIVVDEVTQ